MFASGRVQTLIVTTTAGAQRLLKQGVPDAVEVLAMRCSVGTIAASAILEEVCRRSPGKLILVEGGQRLLGDFYAQRLIDEQFLTLAPQIAGRDTDDRRLGLVMGQAFAPGETPWGTLRDVRRGSSHLFLRYSFSESRTSRI